MRILIWGNSYPRIGGVETFVANLASALLDRNIEVAIMSDGPAGHGPNTLGVPVWTVPMVDPINDADPLGILQAGRGVRAAFDAFRPDVVHYNASGAEILIFDRVMHASTVAAVTTLHNVLDGINARSAARLFERCSAITAVSDYVRSAVLDKYPPPARGIQVIPNALPGRAAHQAEPAGRSVLALGRMIDDKGFDTLVDAFAIVLRRCPDARLTIAGDGPERELLIRRAAHLGIARAVTFSGWIEPDRVHRAMGEAALIVMPSRWQEPFGLVALEAALAGRPCVATSVGGLPSIVADGDTGRLVPPGQPEAMATAIVGLLSDPAGAAAMGVRARQRAARDFDFDRMIDAYVDTFASAHAYEG